MTRDGLPCTCQTDSWNRPLLSCSCPWCCPPEKRLNFSHCSRLSNLLKHQHSKRSKLAYLLYWLMLEPQVQMPDKHHNTYSFFRNIFSNDYLIYIYALIWITRSKFHVTVLFNILSKTWFDESQLYSYIYRAYFHPTATRNHFTREVLLI